MSTNILEFFSGHLGVTTARQDIRRATPERRRRTRVPVHWPVVLFRFHEQEAITSATDNLNSAGFYCITPTRLNLGESLKCALKVPSYGASGTQDLHNLECQVRVVRVDEREDSSYGIALQIEDYHFKQFD